MNALKYWGWSLLASAGFIWFYLWLYGPMDGPKFSTMDNFELVAAAVGIVCVLLGITVLLIVRANNQNK